VTRKQPQGRAAARAKRSPPTNGNAEQADGSTAVAELRRDRRRLTPLVLTGWRPGSARNGAYSIIPGNSASLGSQLPSPLGHRMRLRSTQHQCRGVRCAFFAMYSAAGRDDGGRIQRRSDGRTVTARIADCSLRRMLERCGVVGRFVASVEMKRSRTSLRMMPQTLGSN